MSSYGEVGTYILSQLLFKLFPDDAFQDDCTYPLSVADFRWKILLPESAAMLIMDDTHVDHHTSLRTMRRSARYGAAKFPHDDNHGYEDMLLEVLASHVPKPPSDISLSFAKSLLQTISHSNEETSATLSGYQPKDSLFSSPSADGNGFRNLPIAVRDSPNIAGTSQIEEGCSLSHLFDSFRNRTRRRKLSRSSIPLILTGFKGEDGVGDQETHVSKKARLA